MQELNPLLASPDGSFGMKATTIKFGVVGALAATEYFVVRKCPTFRQSLHHRELDRRWSHQRSRDPQLLLALTRPRDGAP